MIFGEYKPPIIIVGFRVPAFFWVMIFFPLQDPKKEGPGIVQSNFFEKNCPKLPYFEGFFSEIVIFRW